MTGPTREEATVPTPRMRTLQPPHQGASITLEQAIQALAEIEAEEKARRALRRRRRRGVR